MTTCSRKKHCASPRRVVLRAWIQRLGFGVCVAKSKRRASRWNAASCACSCRSHGGWAVARTGPALRNTLSAEAATMVLHLQVSESKTVDVKLQSVRSFVKDADGPAPRKDKPDTPNTEPKPLVSSLGFGL